MTKESMIRQFRITAFLEATSFLILMAMMVLKYKYDQPIGALIVGFIHGIIYMFYAAGAFNLRKPLKWDLNKTILVLVFGSIPLGGYFVDIKWNSYFVLPSNQPKPVEPTNA